MPNTSSLYKCLFRAVLLLATAWFTGCHTTKKAEQTPVASVFGNHITSRKVLKEMKARYIDYHTLAARIKIDIQSGKTRHNNITAFLRMKRDSIIWISIRPVLGIEMARIILTPDSVKMINNLRQTVYLRSADSVRSLLQIPLHFHLLQDLIIGNPAFIPDKIKHLKTDSSTIYVTLTTDSMISRYQWSKDDFLLKKSHSQIENSPQYADQQLKAYQSSGPYLFSLNRDIRIQSGEQIRLHIEFDQVLFDKPVRFPFNYNPGYKIR